MSAGSTPETWTLREAGGAFNDAFVVSEPSGDLIAICHPPHQNERGRLIAAAPDMLAALRELVKNAVFGEPVPDWLNAWDDARAAIAKATESPGASNLKG